MTVCFLQTATSAPLASQQPPSSWGTAVEGIQLRLTVAPPAADAGPPKTVDLPALHVHIRNRAKSVVTFNLMDFLTGSLEVDGVAHRRITSMEGTPRVMQVGPRLA